MIPTNWRITTDNFLFISPPASSWVRKTHWKGGCGKVHVVSVVDHEEFETGMITSPVWDLRYARVGVVEVKSRDRAHVHTLIALCCYPNINGAIRNLSLNTPTATIFLQFNYFRGNIWVRIWVQFHFLYIFVGRVDRIHKTSHITMLSFCFFPSNLRSFGEKIIGLQFSCSFTFFTYL